VAVKKFMRERADRAALIDEVKGILLGGSRKRMGRYRKAGLETVEDFLRFFMDLGNMAFHSGDPEVVGRFLGSLFELAGAGVVDGDEVLRRVRRYGLKSVQGFDYDSFALMLEDFSGYVRGLREAVYVNSCLGVLRGLALRSVSGGFEDGVMGLVGVFVGLDDHFGGEGMHVNRFYLRNSVISLVYFAGRRGDASMRDGLVADAGGLFGFDGSQPPLVDERPVAASEEVAGSPSPVG